MHLRKTIVLLFAVACSSAPAVPKPPQEGDALTLQQMLDGALAPADGFVRVAQAGGWPIRTSEGYVFAVEEKGVGPWHVTSPNGAFPDAPMTTQGGVAWALVPLAAPDGAQYRFVTRAGDSETDRFARVYGYGDTGAEVSYVSLATPHLERWPGVGDEPHGVAARTLRVWVPSGAPTHFLYANDGQNLFGPGSSWHLQDGAGPTTLLVGIDNTPARMDEYTGWQDRVNGQIVGGKGWAYAAYLEQVVRPFIEAQYGTPQRVGVMGSSLGGVQAYVQELSFFGQYDLIASLSGTMGWGSIAPDQHNTTLIVEYASLMRCPERATFYVDSGGGPGSGCVDSDGDGVRDDTPDATDNYCENQQFIEVLQGLGCGERVHTAWDPGAPHNESAWAARAPAVLHLFESL